MRDAVQYEKNINKFFMTIKAAILADDKTLKKVKDSKPQCRRQRVSFDPLRYPWVIYRGAKGFPTGIPGHII